MTELYAGRSCPAMLDYLLHRRSTKNLTAPGPDWDGIETILRAAARVPDHGKLAPWYFIVLAGDARAQAGELLREAWREREPDASPAKLDLEAERFLRAPVVIGVVSTIRAAKQPSWEQVMSAGAACMNLCLAANALGFATAWLTEWYSYDRVFLDALGVGSADQVAGFIYIGTPSGAVEERARPDLANLTTYWSPASTLRTGQ